MLSNLTVWSSIPHSTCLKANGGYFRFEWDVNQATYDEGKLRSVETCSDRKLSLSQPVTLLLQSVDSSIESTIAVTLAGQNFNAADMTRGFLSENHQNVYLIQKKKRR